MYFFHRIHLNSRRIHHQKPVKLFDVNKMVFAWMRGEHEDLTFSCSSGDASLSLGRMQACRSLYTVPKLYAWRRKTSGPINLIGNISSLDLDWEAGVVLNAIMWASKWLLSILHSYSIHLIWTVGIIQIKSWDK